MYFPAIFEGPEYSKKPDFVKTLQPYYFVNLPKNGNFLIKTAHYSGVCQDLYNTDFNFIKVFNKPSQKFDTIQDTMGLFLVAIAPTAYNIPNLTFVEKNFIINAIILVISYNTKQIIDSGVYIEVKKLYNEESVIWSDNFDVQHRQLKQELIGTKLFSMKDAKNISKFFDTQFNLNLNWHYLHNPNDGSRYNVLNPSRVTTRDASHPQRLIVTGFY